MAAVYSTDLSIYIAETFRNSLDTSNVYLTFGYSTPWTYELEPDGANTSVDSVNETWKYMIGGKRILAKDVHHVIPRRDWVAGYVYDAYDNITDSLYQHGYWTSMYVITDDLNVYKCISNNPDQYGYGQPSLYKPSSTNPASQFQTADQYVWKYMYSLTGEEQIKFLTDGFIPVKTLTGDNNSLQWQVQEDAVAGSIHDIRLNVGGEGIGYTQNNISVIITGDGRYANAYVVRDYTNDVISRIIVDNKGSGYTYANVSFKSSRGEGASAYAIISPPGGHGSDALHELGGSYLMINVDLNGTEGGILDTKNDYRQVAIIANPKILNDSNTMSNLVFSQVTVLTLAPSSTSTDYVKDELVYQGAANNFTFKGIVTSWDSANSLLKLTNVEGSPTSDLIVGNTSTAARYINSTLDPDCQPYSGYLLYKDNITAIERADDQIDDFKLVLRF